MTGFFRRPGFAGWAPLLLLLLATASLIWVRPAHAQAAPPPQRSQPPGPPGAAPPGPRRLPMPLFRPVALPAYGKFPPPPGYIEKKRFNGGLFGVGAAVFLTSYAIGAGYAGATGFQQGAGWVLLPVIGPFVAATQRNFDCGGTPSTPAEVERCQRQTISEAGAVAVLAGVGVGQLLGGSLLVAGLLDRSRIWVREDLVAVNVQVGPGAGFLRVSGRF